MRRGFARSAFGKTKVITPSRSARALLANYGGLMPTNVFPIHKAAAQHQAEIANVDSELCTIATEIDAPRLPCSGSLTR
jgi:hypothetical protein